MPPQATQQPHLQGFCLKPSDGLEPSTPSLPFRFRGGKRGHARVCEGTKAAQAKGICGRQVTRAWTPVAALMFARRSHGLSARACRALDATGV